VQETFLNRDGPYGRCQHAADSELRALVASNGATQVRRYCLDCNQPVTDSISHALVLRQGQSIADLPIHADYRTSARCERCGTIGTGVENHHWAPRHLFEDYEQWPQSLLCPSCHEKWHQIVTPRMTERRAS
jgi:hypothetical protein